MSQDAQVRTAVVIGLGNPFRRDDGAGPAVVDRLRRAGLPGVELAESDGEAYSLIALWERRDLAVLVDAVYAHPAHPGRIHRRGVPDDDTDARAGGASSHAMDPGEAGALARELGRLPARMVMFGIEAADSGYGTGLTPAVAQAVDRVAEMITADVRCASSTPPGGRR